MATGQVSLKTVVNGMLTGQAGIQHRGWHSKERSWREPTFAGGNQISGQIYLKGR